MSGGVVVVVGGEGLDAAAAREVGAYQQGMTAQQQREIERAVELSTREQVQRALKVAEEASRASRSGLLVQTPGTPQLPALPPLPQPPAAPVRGVIVTPNGERIVVGDNQHRVLTVRGSGDNQDVQFYAPNVPTEYMVLILSFLLTLVLVAIGTPLARAYGRRMDRQGGRAGASVFPTDVSDRIERIEQAVEAIAIEVERVSEGQRFTTKLLSELRTPALAESASQYSREK